MYTYTQYPTIHIRYYGVCKQNIVSRHQLFRPLLSYRLLITAAFSKRFFYAFLFWHKGVALSSVFPSIIPTPRYVVRFVGGRLLLCCAFTITICWFSSRPPFDDKRNQNRRCRTYCVHSGHSKRHSETKSTIYNDRFYPKTIHVLRQVDWCFKSKNVLQTNEPTSENDSLIHILSTLDWLGQSNRNIGDMTLLTAGFGVDTTRSTMRVKFAWWQSERQHSLVRCTVQSLR